MTDPRGSVGSRLAGAVPAALAFILASLAWPLGARVALVPGPADGFGIAGWALLLPALAVCGFLPGWGLAGLLGVRDRLARTGLAVLLSALLTIALATAAIGRTGGPEPAVRILVALSLLVALLSSLAALRRGSAGRAGRVRFPWTLVAIVTWTALVVAVYAANPELRFRVDGWFHGAVTERVLALGLPPDDPYYAGSILRYPWAWHVVLAATVQAGAAFGVTAFDAMAGWSALAALAVGATLGCAGRAWAAATGRGARSADRVGAAAVALAVLGTNPLGAWIWLARGVLGSDAGPSALARPFAGGAGEVLLATGWHYPHVSIASFVDKFLTPTAFGLGEAALLGFAGLVVFPPARGDAAGRRRFVAATLIAAVGFLLHAFAGAAILVVALACAIGPGRVHRPGSNRARLTPLAAAALGAILTAPYWVRVIGGPGTAPGGPTFGGHVDMPWSILAVGGVLLALTAFEARRTRAVVAAHRSWIVAAGVLLVLACGVTLVQRNETKFVNLGLLALAVPAGAALARASGPLVVATLLALAPTHALAVAGFLADRGQETPGRRVLSPALAEAYGWIGRHTHPRDIFLEAQPAGARDPDRDLVVFGPRALLWGGESYAASWGYPPDDLRPRANSSRQLAAGTLEEWSLIDLAGRLEDFPYRLYAVRRGEAAAALPLPGGGGTWTRVFANPALALDRFDRALDGRRVGERAIPEGGAR